MSFSNVLISAVFIRGRPATEAGRWTLPPKKLWTANAAMRAITAPTRIFAKDDPRPRWSGSGTGEGWNAGSGRGILPHAAGPGRAGGGGGGTNRA